MTYDEVPEKISDFQPKMNEIATVHIPHCNDSLFHKLYLGMQGEVIFSVECEDGWVFVCQLPSEYWQKGCP